MSVALGVMLSGCSVGPDYVEPELTTATEYGSLQQAPGVYQQGELMTQWWSQFDDPVLEQMLETAVSNNRDLRTAGLRILEARARLGFAHGQYWPQQQSLDPDIGAFTLWGRSSEFKDEQDIDGYQGSGLVATLSWELDFWGRYRRIIDSADAELTATAADYNAVTLILLGEVARGYVNVRTLQKRIQLTQENIEIQKGSLNIAEARFRAGQVTELDVQFARILLHNTEADLPRHQAALAEQIDALVVLMGGSTLPQQSPLDPAFVESASGILARQLNESDRYGQIPEAGNEILVSVPAELLRRRPDIVSAERQLAAQSERIGITESDLYPHFNLQGTFGWIAGDHAFNRGSTGSDQTFDPSTWLFGGRTGFRWDFLNYGRISNRVRVEDARFQQLISEYENTVIEATQEVETNLVAFARGNERTDFLGASVTAALRAVELANLQYIEGTTDFNHVLEALRYLVAQQDLLAETEGKTIESLVSLYQSMGGGWEVYGDRPQVSTGIQQEMTERTNWGNYLPVMDSTSMEKSYPSFPPVRGKDEEETEEAEEQKTAE